MLLNKSSPFINIILLTIFIFSFNHIHSTYEFDTLPGKKYLLPASPAMTAESLILITAKLIEAGSAPLKDFDGPVYLRASEAELKLNAAIS